jgi:alkylation response protein AidB-like acyl-CoA dehydrogenase
VRAIPEEGLNTFLNEEDQSAKAQFELFASEQLAPVAQALASRQANLRYFLQKVAQAGLFALTVPREYGGRGGSFLQVVLLAEATGVYDPGFGLTLAAQATVIELIKRFGTDAQRSRYLPLLAQGELLATFAYFEEDSQEPFAGTMTKVSGQSSDKALSGVKNLVVNGRNAQLFVILAAEEIEQGEKALGLWLADQSAELSFKVTEQGPYVGLRSAFLDRLEFSKCPVRDEDRLGAGEAKDSASLNAKSKYQYEFALSVAKTIMAASAVGMLESILSESAKETRNKELHGAPAGQSQAIQWRLADLAVESSAGRLLTYRAAWSKDEDEEAFLKYAAMCKVFTAKAARFHSAEAMQVLGLLLSGADSQAERAYRDAKMFELCSGTNDEERVLLSRELGI